MLLSVQNLLDQQLTTLNSFITSNITAGGTAIPVRNTNSFTNQYAVQIGKTGEEQSEIRIINTPSGTILPLNTGTLVYDHPLDTPVYQIHYDSIVFKRSTVGTTGTASAIATVSITPDSFYTEYNDAAGVATYAYKTAFYNSVSGDLSSDSSWFLPSGPTFYSLGKLRQRGKDALYNSGYIKTNDIIDDWINEWIEIMTNAAIKVNQGYALGTAAITFGTAGFGTVTDPTFKLPVKLEVGFDGVNFINSNEIPVNRFSSKDYFSANSPRHYWLGDTTFCILPSGGGGTVNLTYAQRTTPLVNETDELPFSLRAYTTGCIEYVLYRAYDLDQKSDQATMHYQNFLLHENNFVSGITPRDQTGPKFIDFTDALSGNDDYGFYF